MIAQNTQEARTLTSVGSGQTVRLVRIHAGPRLMARLVAMGMLPRAQIRVVRNDRPGPCVIRVRDSKVALGRAMADKIEVA
jgi:ferrous iron transport protein A